MWKTYLNFVLGGFSVVLIIGGLLWFFLIEMTPEAALAIVGGLMSLFGWFQTREDKKDQEKDKEESIQATKQDGDMTRQTVDAKGDQIIKTIQTTVKPESKPLSKDAKIFLKLWEHIQTENFEGTLSWLVQYDYVNLKYYEEFVREYLRKRSKSEFQFLSETVENACATFDKALEEFNQFVGQNTIPRNYPSEEREECVVSFYAANRQDNQFDFELHHKDKAEWEKIVPLEREILKLHRELVQIARREIEDLEL